MVYCTACGDTNWADQRYCPTCGRDIHPERETPPPSEADQLLPAQVGYAEESAIGVPAPEAAPEVGTRLTRRRWVLPLAGVLAVLLGAGAGWAWWQSTRAVPDDGDITVSVALSAHPQVRWTHSLHDWVGACSTTATDAASGCKVWTVALTDDRMVLLVEPDSAPAQLVAIDPAGGSVSWRHAFATGRAVVCTSNQHGTDSDSAETLWCLTGEKHRSADPSDDSMNDGPDTSVDAPGSMTALTVQSGEQTGSSDLPSSAGEYSFAGARSDVAFVTTFASESQMSPSATETADGDSFSDSFSTSEDTLDGYQVIKYAADATSQWSKTISGPVTGADFGGQVTVIGGVNYLVGVTDGSGKGLGLRDADGTVVSVAGGAVLGGYQGKVIADGSSLKQVRGLAVDGHTVPGDQYMGYWSTDGSVVPLITASNYSSDGAVTSQLLASNPPYAVRHKFAGYPTAICDGKIIIGKDGNNSTTGDASMQIGAVDPETGATSWHITNSTNPSAICAGRNVVVQDEGTASDGSTTTTLAGYSVAHGKKQWLVSTGGVYDLAGVSGVGIVLTSAMGADNDARDSTYIYVH